LNTHFVRVLLVAHFIVLMAGWAWGDTSPTEELPLSADVKAEIEALSAPEQESAETAVLVRLKRDTLAALTELSRLKERIKKQEEEIAEAPAKLAELQERTSEEAVLPDLKTLSQEDLQNGHAEAILALSTAKSTLANLAEEQAQRSLRRLRLPEEIGRALAQEDSPAPALEVDTAATQAEAGRLALVTRELNTEKERALRVERQFLDATAPLLSAEVDIAESEVELKTAQFAISLTKSSSFLTKSLSPARSSTGP
jgi:hypothetical protein